MKYPVVIAADLHLTAKPDDEYRWKFFTWLKGVMRDKKIKEFFVLGDITDAKDRHPSALVNRLVGNLSSVSSISKVRIIKGNHDYVDANNPFMEFVNSIPGIEFYTTWNAVNINGINVLFLPNAKDYNSEWAAIDFNEYDYIFIHQTIKGSVTSNGFELDGGVPRNYFGTCAKVFAGDIHVPQDVGKITYVGSPYPIRYGDSFIGRVIVLDLVTGKTEELFFPTIKKDVLNIRSPNDLDKYKYSKGDKVKVRLSISRSNFCKWDKLRKECLDKLNSSDIVCGGIEMREMKRVILNNQEKIITINLNADATSALDAFALNENIDDDTAAVGRDLL